MEATLSHGPRVSQLENLEAKTPLSGDPPFVQAGFVSHHAVAVQLESQQHELTGDFDGDGFLDRGLLGNGEWSILPGATHERCTQHDFTTLDVATLPTVCVDREGLQSTDSGDLIIVREGDDFQAAIDRAQPGDVIELEAGAEFHGRFQFGPKQGDSWIQIRSSRYTELPQPGVRIDPAIHAELMPKIIASGAGASGRAIDVLLGAHHYRFQGIEVTSDYLGTGDGVASNLVVLNAQGATNPSDLPHHIVFDHVYLHGTAAGTVLNGIRADGRHVAITDSYLADFQAVGRESHAIYAADGAGPISLVNNHLEAAGVTVLFGGDDPEIEGLVNSDIEIRGNLIRKHESTRTNDFVHKFLLEFKNARRVLVTDNLLENAWADSRFSDGAAVVIKSTNQEGSCSWCVAEDIVLANNIIRQASIGMKIVGRSGANTGQTQRIVVENNLIYNERPNDPILGQTVPFILMEDYDQLHIVHNTTYTEGKAALQLRSDLGGLIGQELFLRNNLIARNQYGLKGNGTSEGTASLDQWVNTYVFENNILYGETQLTEDVYPATTRFFAEVEFVDPDAGNFQLQSVDLRSQLRSIPGADTGKLVTAVCAEIGNCPSNDVWGSWNGYLPWRDIQAADVDGDGRDDIVARANGEWWVAKSSGRSLTLEFWGLWSGTSDWLNDRIIN